MKLYWQYKKIKGMNTYISLKSLSTFYAEKRLLADIFVLPESKSDRLSSCSPVGRARAEELKSLMVL